MKLMKLVSEKPVPKRARCKGLMQESRLFKIILIYVQHAHTTCLATNHLLCKRQCNSHIKVLQQHHTVYSSRAGRVEVEVLAYPVAVCDLLYFWCCDESHFYSLYVQRINVYLGPEEKSGYYERFCVYLWLSVSVSYCNDL